MSTATPTRVVVADDSAMMRQIVSSSLSRAGVQIVGSATNGDEALAVCERERPDALMLDLSMPGLDGIGVLRALRQRGRSDMPVVVVSAFSPAQGARAVDALAEGAFDLVAKPAVGDGLDGFAAALVEKVSAATASTRARISGTTSMRRPRRSQRSTVTKAVLIATSTGGPKALAAVMPRLPAPLGIGTLIVQHMPPGFTKSLAARLDQASQLSIREAEGGEILDPRVALLAPGGKHLRVSNDGRISLTDEPEIGALRPRADLMIADAAKVFGERTLLVVMTGMGSDGLRGAEEVKRRGGRILVEARSTCTVYGMPRAVEEAKLADEVLPLNELADAIAEEAAA
ncbi:MAG TPA: chemotaxis-specific protein-glutamate methyltransferase CheB [Solirubrobacteraceae bacterium]|nr:chemotaxis-specific protein-glutamate methyltransferase CheB [Solirubrobacteraceae bacterium]